MLLWVTYMFLASIKGNLLLLVNVINLHKVKINTEKTFKRAIVN